MVLALLATYWCSLISCRSCSAFPVTMVMGIPTVKRKVKSYLSETLRSLIDKLSPEEKLDCVIIVFVGEVSVCPRSLLSRTMARRRRYFENDSGAEVLT